MAEDDFLKNTRLRPGKKRKTNTGSFFVNGENNNKKLLTNNTITDDIHPQEDIDEIMANNQSTPHSYCKGIKITFAEIETDIMQKALMYKTTISTNDALLMPMNTIGAFSSGNGYEIFTTGYLTLEPDSEIDGQFTPFCFIVSSSCTRITTFENACNNCNSYYNNSIFWKLYRSQSIDTLKEERDDLKVKNKSLSQRLSELEMKCEDNEVKIISLKAQIEKLKKTHASEVFSSWMENEQKCGRTFTFGNFKKEKDRKRLICVMETMSTLYENQFRNNKTSESYLIKMELLKRSLGNILFFSVQCQSINLISTCRSNRLYK